MLKKVYNNYISQNLGLINMFGKVFGRSLYLVLLALLSHKLSLNDFANFAIFWATLRMFTFYTANNLYIIYFDEVRTSLMKKREWPKRITTNIVFTYLAFSTLLFVVSLFLFENVWVTILLMPCLLCYIIIRNLSEFAKADNNLLLSIFIEEILFYFLFFITGVASLFFFNNLISVIFALLISLLLTAITCLILFRRKFEISIKSYSLASSDFSFSDFKLGFNYTILRGNEVLSNFAVRYLGQIYYGDLFVGYAHIMYQFYNIFCLLAVAVVSGFQSKITISLDEALTREFFNKMYKKVLTTLLPFVVGLLIVVVLLNAQILEWFFPKYIIFGQLLIKVSLAGVFFAVVQPFVFIFIYNKLFHNIMRLNAIQYAIMTFMFSLPYFYSNFDEQYWLLLMMTLFVMIQGFFAVLNYNRIR